MRIECNQETKSHYTISKVENLARQLRDVGETVSDVAIITKILES